MPDGPLRKFVKPAHPAARIPDPAHRGLPLPAEGAEVAWDHYWILREQRGEVIVDEQAATVPAAPAAANDAVAVPPAASTGIPFMITNAMRDELRQRGLTDDEIAQMTPADAHAKFVAPPAG